MNNKLISLAYTTYGDVISILDTITDNSFVSATEIAQLLNVILGVKNITASHIMKLFLAEKLITKISKQEFIKQQQLGLKPSRYIPSPSVIKFSKKLYLENYSFYIWDICIFFRIFNIDLKYRINKNHSKYLCKKMSKYTCSKYDSKIAYSNLQKLQLILQQFYW